MTQPTTSPVSATAEQRRAQALQRIEASRTQLILTLAPKNPKGSRQKTAQGSGASARKPQPNAPFSESLAAHMQQEGVGKGSWHALTGAANDWLGSQPWYASVELVGSTLVHQAKPIVRRHPWICLGAAAATGAALVALRPWGWQPVQHRITPWRSQVGSMVWGQLTQAPVQMALAGALAAWLSGNNGGNGNNGNSVSPVQGAAPDAPLKPPPPPAPVQPSMPPSASTGDAPAASSPGVMPAATSEALAAGRG